MGNNQKGRYGEVISVRLNAKEKTKLDELVASRGTSKSEFIRSKIKGIIRNART